ncbi:ATP-dependent helicase HrpB [Desertimonas flava]|uniref:ATP-dependent helicase HrpB n=1 Tax=Desertimonas flava TaxID=2064846 RepID=UPI001D0CD1D9|nr:ATP-dependent helicase HrpB [Desertimonas flava]
MPGIVALPAPLPDLPIRDAIDGVLAALAHHGRAVVSAPPGAGKTTVVPLALLGATWRGDGRILVLEPRRLATRAAARRMADLLGEPVGGVVGYQTRDERRIGPGTRIEVLTEGVLTRRLQSDPELPGVVAVLFDEVHERNLTTDLGLALTLDVASTLRPDLRIVAMSATADTASFSRLLATGEAGPAPIVESAGRMFPVDIRWVPRARHDRSPIDATVVSTVLAALRDEPGDALVFLPGIGEILRTRDRLVGSVPANVDVRPLAGALTLEDQDLALAPSPPGRRRVVLATDIAETSLTVDGVRIVVDSGLARSPRFDSGTGMTRLTTVSISRDSAEQRTGRAGRVEPGVCYRLWSKIEHGSRPAHQTAEMLAVDLAGLALELAAWGTPPEQLAFADPPPARTWRQAIDTLTVLGAIDGDGRLTEIGRAMVNLPLHPRLARVVAGAPTAAACVVAALLDDRDVMRGRIEELPADLALRVGLVTGRTRDDRADRGAVHRARDRAADLARRAGIRFDLDTVDPDRTGLLLLAGFPDRLAGRRRGGQFQLRSGSGAWVGESDPLASAPFVVAADVDGKRSGSRIRLAAAVEAWEIAGVLDDVVEHRRLEWDRDRDDLVERVERRLDALRLGEEVRAAEPGEETVEALVARVRATKLGVLRWTDTARQLQARLGFLRATIGDAASVAGERGGWPDVSDAALTTSLDEWLRPYLIGATGRADLERVDIAVLLRNLLPWPQGAQLDELAPAAWPLPTGRSARIDYGADRPTLSVRVQDVFGMTEHPTIAGGRVPVTMALLSPADRPIQVTADLPGFWAGSWADVRKDLAGRYPKHRWPVDPANERPGRR